MQKLSENMEKYFSLIDRDLSTCYEIANHARSKGFDPEDKVDIPLTKNMAERVEGLISAVKPELIKSGMSKRIEELEERHGRLSLEVAMQISFEVSQGRFCKFEDKIEAIETGIRTGFAYLTIGVVSAPLEGFTALKIKKTRSGKEYFAAMFSGPVRGAGGTAMAQCIIIADHLRKKHGYDPYDPSEEEQARIAIEMQDYHERVTNLQYIPSPEEIKFLVKNCPIEVDGEPTEKFEVSQHKDLPRIDTNRIRGGVALVISMMALKANKLIKDLSRLKNQDEFNVGWGFIEDFLKLQTRKKSHSEKPEEVGLTPDYTFVSDAMAGRPVLTDPLAQGGFRLRYGKTRISGYSAVGINPATTFILDKCVATGTQLKVERPGKAASLTPCDNIDGPIVKLKNGSVMRIDIESEAREIAAEVEEILYLGDFLVSYGDFLDRNHVLVPPGYCEEWHFLEKEKALPDSGTEDKFEDYLPAKFPDFPSAERCLEVSEKIGIPLHPRYTYFWSSISKEDVGNLIKWLGSSAMKDGKLVIPPDDSKRILELLGVPHQVGLAGDVVLQKDDSTALMASLGMNDISSADEKRQTVLSSEDISGLDIINRLSRVEIRDKAGTFIGARMGRPEKSKMRQLRKSPHVLFPVGEQGGAYGSFNHASTAIFKEKASGESLSASLEKGKVLSDFPLYFCRACREESIYRKCQVCSGLNERLFHCSQCGEMPCLNSSGPDYFCGKCSRCRDKCPHEPSPFHTRPIDIRKYFDYAKKLLGEEPPPMIKGVKGTSNRDHVIENLFKGVLRAKHNVSVNKDGTVRYDMSELPITHFTPEEIMTPVETLRELGYEKDVNGDLLVSGNQIVEILPQDIILPLGAPSDEQRADRVLTNVANFVDELLIKLYGLKAFYNIKERKDIVGHLVISIAPHISAGITGRILGFSKTNGFLAHPLFHAAMRRDCDGDEACVILALDALINFSRQYLPDSRGAKTMDSPLVLTHRIIPSEVDDMAHRLDVVSYYPLEFYEAASNFRMPYEVDIEILGKRLGTERELEGFRFTHTISSINSGNVLSVYKTLPSMLEKLDCQMNLARKIRAVDCENVARLVIETHFLKDIRGNLRKFSLQQFTCKACGRKNSRPLLSGRCSCEKKGELKLTVSQGGVVKYLEPAIDTAEKYEVSDYLKQVLALTRQRVEDFFGKEKQEALSKWFG